MLEIDFLKGLLAAYRGTADGAGINRESAIFRKVREEVNANRGLRVKRMVRLARVNRANYYHFDENARSSADSEMDLRNAIQWIALEWPSYGRRRITHELRHWGWMVNAKRVHRILREDNLLCVRKRTFVVRTDCSHGRRAYPNLAPSYGGNLLYINAGHWPPLLMREVAVQNRDLLVVCSASILEARDSQEQEFGE
jgi:HTH-like domain